MKDERLMIQGLRNIRLPNTIAIYLSRINGQ